jgi:transposase
MDLSDSLRFCFGIVIRELEHLWQIRKELRRQLITLARSKPYKETVQILKSAPGIGIFTAIRLALEWGDLTRFKRKEDFASFLGLIPSEYSSGETERKGHITKQGNRGVRSWLVECSWVAIRYDPVLQNKFQRVYRRCRSRKKAIVAVARKLAIRLRALLLNRQAYMFGTVE